MKKVLLVLLLAPSIIWGQVFSSDFEDENLAPENDGYVCDLESGTITVVSNPDPNGINSSNYVARAQTTANYYGDDSSHSRAEYRNSSRMTTEGHEHIFQWDVYFPVGWLDDVEFYNDWFSLCQFYTEPCSKYSNSTDSYYDIFYTNIAYSGGIFNSFTINTDGTPYFEAKFRAVPDQNIVEWYFNEGVWQTITLQIYWTTDDTGYYNLYIDGELLEGHTNVQTLPTGWVDGTCDMRFKVGQYTSWRSDSQTYLTSYFDNVEWYIDGDLTTIMETSNFITDITDITSNYKANIYPNPVDNILSVDISQYPAMQVTILIYDLNGNIISTTETTGGNTELIKISELSSGIYIVNIVTNNTSISLEFVKN